MSGKPIQFHIVENNVVAARCVFEQRSDVRRLLADKEITKDYPSHKALYFDRIQADKIPLVHCLTVRPLL